MTPLTIVCAVQLIVAGVVILALLHFQRVERREVAAERRDLLLRIQAPQVAAAIDYNQAAEENPSAIDMSDGPMGDESYWVSREELAEKLAEEETARG